MPDSCHVCPEGNGAFRFPKCVKTRQQWITSLGLQSDPPPGARLCPSHFSPGEIVLTANGRRMVRHGAVPTPGGGVGGGDRSEAHHSTKPTNTSQHSDHIYSQSTKSYEAGSVSVLMMLAPLLLCFLPLLVLFLYYWTCIYNTYPPPTTSSPTTRITPVLEGETFIP